MPILRRAGLTSLLILLLSLPALAVTTAFWRLSSQPELMKGKTDHVAITSDGVLTLSPSYDPVAGLEALYVWSVAVDGASNLYAGTGDRGVIYKIAPRGKAVEFCKLPESHVLSLASDSLGNLFAGTAPRGLIYKVTTTGQATVFARTNEAYVWALAWSPDGTILYAATGPHGKVLRIARSGEVSVLLDSGQNHILCLAVGKDGALYAGSEPGGLIYKVAPQGKAFVLYDAAEGDVHSLVLDADGNLYAGTAFAGPGVAPPAGRIGPTPTPEPLMPVPLSMGESAQDRQQARPVAPLIPRPPAEMPAPAPPPPKVTAKNSIYKIAPDGRVSQGLVLDGAMILSLAISGDFLWAGTGNDGVLYRLPLNDLSKHELVLDVDDMQLLAVTALPSSSAGSDLAVATGNLGRVYRVKGGFSSQGAYVSPVFDTGSISQWGAVSWEGEVPAGTSFSVAIRTGNSERPDNTWSHWSRAVTASGAERIKHAPPARFVQLRATLTSSSPDRSPRIREIKLPYLMLNMPPQVSKLTFDGASAGTTETTKPAAVSSTTGGETMADKVAKMVATARGKEPSETAAVKAAAPTPGAIPVHKVERTISWEAKDPDGDKLEYALFYRGLGEKEWKLLKDKLTANSYTWDTETVPDGEYELMLLASDGPSNPPDRTQKTEKVSLPFLIDNTRPFIESLKATSAGQNQWKIQGRAQDALNIILEIQYSLDAGDWVSIYPKSGIFDSKTAEFEFTLEGLTKGEHTVIVRATDAAGNRGAGKVVFR